MCIKNNKHNNSSDNHDNDSTNYNNQNKFKKFGTRRKRHQKDWLELNHLEKSWNKWLWQPTTLPRFESSRKTVISMKDTARH